MEDKVRLRGCPCVAAQKEFQVSLASRLLPTSDTFIEVSTPFLPPEIANDDEYDKNDHTHNNKMLILLDQRFVAA